MSDFKAYPDIEEWTDQELIRAWDHLEKLELTPYVEKKMDEIDTEIGRREIRKSME